MSFIVVSRSSVQSKVGFVIRKQVQFSILFILLRQITCWSCWSSLLLLESKTCRSRPFEPLRFRLPNPFSFYQQATNNQASLMAHSKPMPHWGASAHVGEIGTGPHAVSACNIGIAKVTCQRSKLLSSFCQESLAHTPHGPHDEICVVSLPYWVGCVSGLLSNTSSVKSIWLYVHTAFITLAYLFLASLSFNH